MEMASHQPAHPINEDVEFSAIATGEVDKVELWMTEYFIAPDKSLTASGPSSMIKSCDPAFWKSTVSCTTTMPMTTDHTLIEYEARAFAFWGSTESEIYRFASGQYHRTADELPDEYEPIPIRINSDNTGAYLDVAMIPDPDLLIAGADPLANFRLELANVIGFYFKYDSIRKARGLYNFYYSPFEGQYIETANCDWVGPENLSTLLNTADVVLYLHQATMWDCKEGAKISSEIDYDKTLVHESGHGLFGVRDEYKIGSSTYYPGLGDQVCNRNIWLNSIGGKTTCENEVPPGLEAADCTYILPPGQVWRIDPADAANEVGCIMGDLQHSDFSDFGPACLRRIDWRYNKCLDGECMTIPECP